MSNRSQLEFWRQTPQDKRLAISSIHVTAPGAGLRRIPAGFYIAVQIDGDIWRTTVKAEVPSSNVVHWDEVFVLPADNSLTVSLRIFAAFEFERMLGRGELLHEAELTVGELLRHSSQLLPILFSPDAGKLTSLRVRVDRDIQDQSEATQFGQRYSPRSGEPQRLGQMTEISQNLLACYRRTRCISDYHAATDQLRLTLDHCGSDHPDRAAALTNLADALAIHPHIEENDGAINAPISLYQEALGLRKPGHPDRPLALLRLGLALLYRYQIRKNPADVTEGQELLNRAQSANLDVNADTTPVNGSFSGTTNSIQRSHCSSPVPMTPPSPLSPVPTIPTAPQRHKFPDSLGRTADLSTRSVPMSPRMANGESFSVHRHAELTGDEKESAAVSLDEIKAPFPACRSTQAPLHSGIIPYTNSVTNSPHLPPGILSRECSVRCMAPPVDMRVMQSQQVKCASPLTRDPFLPLPTPAALDPAPIPFISRPRIVLIPAFISLSILLFMTCPSYLWP